MLGRMFPPGQTTEVPLIWKLRPTSGHFRIQVLWMNGGNKAGIKVGNGSVLAGVIDSGR